MEKEGEFYYWVASGTGTLVSALAAIVAAILAASIVVSIIPFFLKCLNITKKTAREHGSRVLDSVER